MLSRIYRLIWNKAYRHIDISIYSYIHHTNIYILIYTYTYMGANLRNRLIMRAYAGTGKNLAQQIVKSFTSLLNFSQADFDNFLTISDASGSVKKLTLKF